MRYNLDFYELLLDLGENLYLLLLLCVCVCLQEQDKRK